MSRVWESMSENGQGWFRLFGVGLYFKDTTRHLLLFSERNGYRKGFMIGKWRVGPLQNPKHVIK